MPPTSHGSGKWPTSHWRTLLAKALPALEALPGRPEWSLGGGTALAVHYEHRISYDVDLFIKDPAALHALAPARNPIIRRMLGSNRFDFPGPYLKLRLQSGEIDFINAPSLSAQPTVPYRFEGRTIALETPVEIALKKLFYRSSRLQLRDVFDLAVISDREGEPLAAALELVADRLPRIQDRVESLRPSYPDQARLSLQATPEYERYLDSGAELVGDFLRAHAPPRSTAGGPGPRV